MHPNIHEAEPLQSSHKYSIYQSATKFLLFNQDSVSQTDFSKDLSLWIPQDATMEKPSQAKTLTKRPKSWETLKIYTHKHVYVMTKWETIDHLITTLGLIVILHMSLYTLISNNAVFIYSTLVCITGNFPLCDLPSAMIFKLHPLVYRSSGFCCVQPSFSSCCDNKNYSWEGFLFFFIEDLFVSSSFNSLPLQRNDLTCHMLPRL